MSKRLLPAVLATALMFALGACARGQPKSSARIYPGDGPSIKYIDRPESAGGAIQAQ